MTAHAAKTVRLLVAEDNPLVRDLIQKGLDPHCEVVIAEDGGDALLKVIDEPPDVILCDYKMPGLNGRQLFEKLRGREQSELFFASGQCRDAQIGGLEGDDAVYKVILWTAGEFEIDFNAASASSRTTITRGTTGLLMEAMRLMDESSRDAVETP